MDNRTGTYELLVRSSWFQNGLNHHIYLGARLSRAVGAKDNGPSLSLRAFVDGVHCSSGALHPDTWFYTDVDQVFRALNLSREDIDRTQINAEGRRNSNGAWELHFWRKEAKPQGLPVVEAHPPDEKNALTSTNTTKIASPLTESDVPAPPPEDLTPTSLGEEDIPIATYTEGATRQILVNAYERDRHARRTCIDYYGLKCVVCGFDFERVYGMLGHGFIHVHHLVPLSTCSGTRQLDPVRDLRPLCANCHAMVHRRVPPLAVQELKEIVSERNPGVI